ncbi:MAG: class I SAM-dependent methyltransferase [Candidatus Lokiarchaeota archaeon]|nr:class I SAM-dependent methyltransferase [Candidatus Lokiarchaeota archaeon]
MIKIKKNEEKFDFGWSHVWMNAYWIIGLSLIIISVLIYFTFPFLEIMSFVLILISINLFGGNYVWRRGMKIEYITLPFVDLFSSDEDLILDACCGTGRTSIAISKVMKKGNIIALDRFDANYIENGGQVLLEKNLKIARIHDKVTIVKGDITDLDFKDSHFDSIISTYAIDHLGKNKLKALKEINRVLKLDGKFLLVVFVPNIITFLAANILCLSFISKKKWKRLFSLSNFNLLDEGMINGTAYFLLEKSHNQSE